jgi:capsular exopolysaccharide synthesis family protein
VRAQGGSPQAIAISGPEAGVGKTFIAVNLALLWANSTFERVLLIDGDLRRPQFHSLFEIPQRPGLADVLARRVEPEECTRFVSEVGLHVMPAGRAGNPRQLVNPDRVGRVIESLKAAYDLVILDGPPLMGMVDARSFAGACDGTLMVVRAGRTRMRSLQKAKAELPPDRLIGAVVNGAENGIESAYSGYQRAARG